MRNWRTLTDDEMQELERLYPVTTNRELSRRFDVSVDAIQDRIAYPRGWKKDTKTIKIGRRGGRSLTEKEQAWLIRHYKNTKNADILQRFGIGESQLHRLARKLGLKKTRQQMKKMQHEATIEAREVCNKYGVYEETRKRMKQVMAGYKERGERYPGSFQPGVTNVQRLGKRRERERIMKAHKTRNESIRKDRVRIHFGLPQKLRLKIHYNGYTETYRKKSVHRNLFRKHNYIVERGSDDIYYDEQTDRRPRMEANASRYGLRVLSVETVRQ